METAAARRITKKAPTKENGGGGRKKVPAVEKRHRGARKDKVPEWEVLWEKLCAESSNQR